jgi:predicted esterase
MRYANVFALAMVMLGGLPALAQEDVADVPNERVQIEGAPQQAYFLIGAKPGAKAPENGYPLLLMLPGGKGNADFNPFVRRIWQNALPEGFLVAQLLAVESASERQVVWPTAKSKDPKQTFTTEQFIEAVVKDVKAKHPVDDARVYALAWSSGGPAVYASILNKGSPIRGAFVAMSVFFPNQYPPLANAQGKRFYLLQSPQDGVTRFSHAEQAKRALTAAGATVELSKYEGGHGWKGDAFGMIREGIDWLEQK